MKTNVRRIGAHVTTAGGLHKGIARGKAIGANCLQIFSSSPRSWKRRTFTDLETQEFRQGCANHDLQPVFIHAPYLINLGTENQGLLDLSIRTLMYELSFCARISGQGVVVHLGSGAKTQVGFVQRVVVHIERILDMTPASSILIIENCSGKGGTFPQTLEQCGEFAALLSRKRIQFCIDTQHAFAAGYDFFTPAGAEKFVDVLDRTAGIDRVALIHVNDSKVVLGSGKDRHENLGEGAIGLSGLSALLSRSEIAHIPAILETPGFDGTGPDTENIRRAHRVTQGMK